MTYETYRYIFIGGGILAAVMLLVSLFLFIRFRIPNIIGDITGSTAKKAVRRISRQNSIPGSDRSRRPQRNFPVNYSSRQPGKKPDSKSTTPLYQEEYESSSDNNMTMPLSMLSSQHYPDEGEMTVQFGAPEAAAEAFEVEKDITFIHTDEVIV